MVVARFTLLALLAIPTISQPSDEIVAVAEACGKPQWIRRAPLPQVSSSAATERLHYTEVDLIFQRDKPGGHWDLNRVTLPRSEAPLPHDAATQAMPCLEKTVSRLPLLRVEVAPASSQSPSPAYTPPLVPAHKASRFPLGMVVWISASVALMGTVVLYFWRRPKTLEQDSRWLCLNCHTISEPAKSEDGELHCAVCSYGTPVPFESAEAKEYFTASGFKPRESP